MSVVLKFQRDTPPKTNGWILKMMETLEKVTPFKNAHFWYQFVEFPGCKYINLTKNTHVPFGCSNQPTCLPPPAPGDEVACRRLVVGDLRGVFFWVSKKSTRMVVGDMLF